MGSNENKELTKKVLTALDPKYILGQGQQGKITNVFRKFRERTQDLQAIAQKAAITGEKHLEKKGFFKRAKEWRSKQPFFNPTATRRKSMYENLNARGKMPHTSKIKPSNYRNPNPWSGGNKTRKLSNTSANSMRK